MNSALFDTPWGAIAVSVAVGCLILAATVVALARPRGAWLRDRLGPYGGPEGTTASQESDTSWRLRMDSIFGATERRLSGTHLWKGVEATLTRAGMTMPAVQLVWISVAASVVALVVFAMFTHSFLLAFAAAVIAGAVPLGVVSHRARTRMRTFDDQLPDVLQTMAGSLQVGHSFNQSLQAIVDEGQQPAADEFARVIAEMRFGRPGDEALESMGERLRSDDFDYVLMSVRIQRQVGGSLAGLFETVAHTVRERQQFRRKLRAITATGRLSAYMLVSLPFATAILISVIRPHYLAPLLSSPGGRIAIVVSLVMIVIGAFILRRIVDIKG